MKEINSVVYSEKEPSKECLWLHYVNDKLTLEAFGNTGWVSVQESELSKIGNLEDLATEAKNSLVEAINEVAEGGSSGGGMVEITYSELKSLRDNNKLVPGTQYRITDYHCTTSQENTTSADHQFDIIVTADSESVLNENARAIQHEGDTYFANSKLEAWELKYCLNNDRGRFAWAVHNSGYLVEDVLFEDANKNIIIEGESYHIFEESGISIDEPGGWALGKKEDTFIWLYNNDGEVVSDGEVGEEVKWVEAEYGTGIIYYMKDEFGNECPYDFKNIQFYRWWNEDKQMWCDTNGDEDNFVAAYTFSSRGDSETTSFTDCSLSGSNQVYSNIIKKLHNGYNSGLILNNICFFGAECSKNIFENDCKEISFGEGCSHNIFGSACRGNSFMEYCSGNSFGVGCTYISFMANCENNSFGNRCRNITFGNRYNRNSFGKECEDIEFLDDTSGAPGNYFSCNTLEDCVRLVTLYTTSTSEEVDVRNYHIKSSVGGYARIEVTRGLTYDTTIARNSSGVLKTYCEADLLS